MCYPNSEFLERNFQHLHAAVTLAAARDYARFVKQNDGKMIVSLASDSVPPTIEKLLAPMIRAGLIHAIVATGSAIEVDLNSIATAGIGDSRIPRKTITALHEDLRYLWARAGENGHRYFHWEIIYQLLNPAQHNPSYQQLPSDSWLCAAYEYDIPVYAPGIENSTLGRLFCADVIAGKIASHSTMKSGTEQYEHLSNWYLSQQKTSDIGLFQIGDSATGDFSRYVVSSIVHDQKDNCKLWRHYTHITDTTPSRVGIVHNTINTYIQNPDTQTFKIDADASTFAPLIFNYVLEQWARQQAADLLSSTVSNVNYG